MEGEREISREGCSQDREYRNGDGERHGERQHLFTSVVRKTFTSTSKVESTADYIIGLILEIKNENNKWLLIKRFP